MDYKLLSCGASYLPAGTSLYTIHGEDPHHRLALADGRIYTALPD